MTFNIYAKWDGPIIIIGFGSIGRAVLPLLLRHIQCSPTQVTVIDPAPLNKNIAEELGVNFNQRAITKENYEQVLQEYISATNKQSIIVNASVNISSKDVIKFALDTNTLYIDTTIDPWEGGYFNEKIPLAERSNYALRESLLELKQYAVGKTTAISCCGANPGMVSWFVKEALLNLASDTNIEFTMPKTRNEWASLMMKLGIKTIHIAENDSQQANIHRDKGTFINTWSVDGFLAEALQPSELGWGTHENNLPIDGHVHTYGSKCAIYLDRCGGDVRIQTWTPTKGSHFGFLVTHNEAISISHYFSVESENGLLYRPTCHYAYKPTSIATDSIIEVFSNNKQLPLMKKVLNADEIQSGKDELGVLLMGHERNAYWYGSQLTIEEARNLAPYQSATGLQVSSALLAGLIWAIKNPNEGLCETEEIDHDFCLNIQRQYLGEVSGYYTDWKPSVLGNKDSDPWQFTNIEIPETKYEQYT
jgi:homospermidine synthase